jgi:RNA polymerase sigma-70 factor (ECF subfamily)
MPSDGELLEAWRAGDRAAGDQLIVRHHAAVYGFFRRQLGDDIDDLVQRTFLDCVEHQERIDGERFRTFLFTVARNRLYDHLRAVYRSPSHEDLDSRSLADLGTTPSRHVARDQETRQLLAAMRTLPLEQSVVLELAYFEEMSGPEIAEVIGVPPNTIRSRLSRARDALREALARADRSKG